MEASERYLADDFQTLDKDGSVQMNREQYMGLAQPLFPA